MELNDIYKNSWTLPSVCVFDPWQSESLSSPKKDQKWEIFQNKYLCPSSVVRGGFVTGGFFRSFFTLVSGNIIIYMYYVSFYTIMCHFITLSTYSLRICIHFRYFFSNCFLGLAIGSWLIPSIAKHQTCILLNHHV